MSGPATAIQSNLIVSHHPQTDQSNTAVNSSDSFAASSVPRGQVNAWGWPSGFHQPPSAPHNDINSDKLAAAVAPRYNASPGNMYNHQQGQQQSLQQAHPSQPPHHHQQQQQQQQPNSNSYPPQPYANSSVFTGPSHSTMSPNAMSKKRTASNSPDFEKDKRSRPDLPEGKPESSTIASASADGRVWGEEATKLDVYVWDYLTRRGFGTAAKALMSEAGMAEPPEVPLKTPQGLLFEYWAIFWDVFAARSGRGGTEAAAYFEYQESRNMQRLVEANRKVDMLEANYQPADNSGRFPNIVANSPLNDLQSNGRPPNAQWNPAALPPAQQQQLLITAAQRQNIPLHEIKNLPPASRLALINSMNPNGQPARPPIMGNQQMEQQLQVRLQQQQALHRMMQQQQQQQQRQGGGPGVPMPSPGLSGGPQLGAQMQIRPPGGPPQGMTGVAGSPAPPTPGGGVQDGRRSAGPPGLGPDSNRPEHMQGMPPGVQQPGMQGGPQGVQQAGQQHPQLSPQQQQLVMNQFQSVQAAMREEWMKAQSAPSQAAAAEFYANVQAYQVKAQGLQNLLRAQANHQGNQDPNGPQQGGQAGPMMQGGQPGQPRPPHMMMGPGNGGPNPGAGSPAVLNNLTPQQRAAQIANAQAAAGRITPAMATHDPGLMATMMGPNTMPNGTGSRAPTPQNPAGAQMGDHMGLPNNMHPQGAPNQFQQPGRPSSAQGGPDDPHLAHFSSVQMGSPANMQRPGMQRSASSQLAVASGGMGPPGATPNLSHSPRLQASTLQSQMGQGASPAPVAGTPKLGSAEKAKKATARQRKNSKATTSKTPTLSAASVPTANNNNSNGGANSSTPAANAATPVSANAATPGREANAKPEGGQTQQPAEPSMPPPSGPLSNEATSQVTGNDEQAGADAGSSGANGTGAGGADDFMYGFGGSMNDIFDFDLSTDAVGAQSLGGDTWDSNFSNLFANSGSGQADGMSSTN